jgi:hypothetical protein
MGLTRGCVHNGANCGVNASIVKNYHDVENGKWVQSKIGKECPFFAEN